MELDGKTALTTALTALGIAMTAFWALWRNIMGRIRDVDAKVDAKADISRVESLASNLGEAFKQQREDMVRGQDSRERMMDAMTTLTGQFHESQLAIGRMASHMESERDTRARRNSALDQRLTDIEATIDRNGAATHAANRLEDRAEVAADKLLDTAKRTAGVLRKRRDESE